MINKSIILKILTFVLCVCLLVVACGCSNEGTPETKFVNDPVLSESSYKLNDRMGDYTITDVNGNTYTFSQLLNEKKAIVLNFWFINCGPCQMEFPYLQKAYDKYKDDIAVIAINPTDDKENSIKKYATQNELSIPLVKGDEAWISAFSLQGFPTTIVIDRYGNVAFYHVGSVTQEGVFEKMFEFFINESYRQTTIYNMKQ